jgi:hypothetical protein
MHLFNVAVPAEATRPDPMGWHDLQIYRWRLVVGDLPDGRKVLIGTRWRDWFARLLGHAPVLVDPRSSGPKSVVPAAAKIVTMRSETKDERRDRVAQHWKKFRVQPGRATPFDSFRVVNASGALGYREKDPPQLLYYVDSDHWLQVRMPYLTIHRDVKEPAVLGKDGQVVRPARVRRKLARPYYVDPAAIAELSGIHWKDAIAAALGWIPQERAYRRIEELRQENYALRAALYVLADEKSEISAQEIFTLLDRERFPITLEAAEEEVGRPTGDSEKDSDGDDQDEGPRGPRAPARHDPDQEPD